MVSPARVLSCLGLLSSCASAATTPNTIELAVTSNFANTTGRYFVDVTVGTPGQLQTMEIDTGSSNAIILASNASFCETSVCEGGTLNSSASSTFETIMPGALRQPYASQESFKGDYFRDRVQLNDITITNLPMGTATDMLLRFTPYTGILGLGCSSSMAHPTFEEIKNADKVALPPNFVEALVQAGAISLRLYSIYLNSLDRLGSIILGGIDTAKYHGTLTTLNVVAWDEKPVHNFLLYLDSVTMQPHDGPNQTIFRSTKEDRYLTVPDTGTPSWCLPTSTYQRVVEHAGVISADDTKLSSNFKDSRFVRPCSELIRGNDNTTRFEIAFAGNGTNTGTLNVELADLFTPLTSEDGSAVTDEAGRSMCWLRIEADDRAISITGSAVMRAGYWVFDLDNGQVSLAQANLRTNSSSNVVQVEAGADGLSKAANELKAETKKIDVEGQMSSAMVYSLSTATSSVGYSTGMGFHPTATGTTESVRDDPTRPRSSELVRRFESAAAALRIPRPFIFRSLGAFIVALSITITIVG